MCRLHQLSDAEKISLQAQLLTLANSIGGKNAFLKLIETIRKTTPNPLISKTSLLRFPKGLVRWNKTVHQDNLTLLSTQMNARTQENQNLMVSKEHKNYKAVTNMLRALGSLNFTVTMHTEEEGKGFSGKAFDIIDDETTQLNPIFEILFFCPVNITKKLLNFTVKEGVIEDAIDETEE